MNVHGDSRPAVYTAGNTGVTPSDAGTIGDIVRELESLNSLAQQNGGKQSSDTNQTAINHSNDLTTDSPIRVGKVLLAIPYIHCYRVQLSGQQGVCIAAAVSTHAHTPIGVRCGNVIPPNSDVLVWKPKSSNLAYILGVLPCSTFLDEFNPSDIVQQGGNSGPKKVPAYRNIPKAATNAHGWIPQSSGRPIDGNVHEYVRMSETGTGLLIDSFQAYLRVNEACGLFLNYFDSYAKLVGLSMDIMSYCQHVIHRYDEGETFALAGSITYPWEAVGMYGPSERFTTTNNPESVQLDKGFPFAAEDLTEDATDQEPIYRYAEYTGYIGQGSLRTVIRPAKTTGKRLMRDAANDKDIGLFQESLTLDGEWGVKSAKALSLVKYPVIPVPRRRRAVEDAKGDDLTHAPDYKFSGMFGEGDEHKVNDWKSNETTVPFLLRSAGVVDMLARHYNWKSTHAFAYHKEDYNYPEESEVEALGPVQHVRGNKRKSFVDVEPVKLQIDPRYADVNYYNTMSLISITEDGSVVLADGFASRIVLTGGQIRLESTGDLMLLSGSRVISMADEVITRAKGSVDISSSDADVRIKAERNLQMLSADGGVLIEAKGEGSQQTYKDKIGEDVQSSGIVLLSRGGSVNTMAQSVYIRSGVETENPEGSGAIIMDCANGRSPMISYAKMHGFFNSQGVGIWHSPAGQDQVDIDKSHFFGPTFAKINGPTLMQKSVVICEGSLGVDESIYANKHIAAIGRMAQDGGGTLGDSSKDGFAAKVQKFIDDFCESGESLVETGTKLFEGSFTSNVWEDNRPGNTDLLGNDIGFSFRDKSDSGNTTYGYENGSFFMPETRWQQLSSAGLVSAGDTWQENTVSYQGRDLMPWPGRRNWKDTPAFLQYNGGDGFVLFNPAGHANSRGGDRSKYEEPEFGNWKKSTCDESYSL